MTPHRYRTTISFSTHIGHAEPEALEPSSVCVLDQRYHGDPSSLSFALHGLFPNTRPTHRQARTRVEMCHAKHHSNRTYFTTNRERLEGTLAQRSISSDLGGAPR